MASGLVSAWWDSTGREWVRGAEAHEIIRLYEFGYSINRIMQMQGRGRKAIVSILKAHGVCLRTRDEQARMIATIDAREASFRKVNPKCCHCGMRLELVRVVRESKYGRCCDMCYCHVNKIRRKPQGRFFWSEKGWAENGDNVAGYGDVGMPVLPRADSASALGRQAGHVGRRVS